MRSNFIQRQAEVLKDADGADLDEGVDGVVAVSGGAVLDVRLLCYNEQPMDKKA